MKYLKLFEDFQDEHEILFMAETKGGKYRIEVYQDEIDKRRNKYSFTEFTNNRERGHGGSYNKAQMNVWLNYTIEGSAKIDGINYIVKSNKGGFDILDIEKDKPYKPQAHYHRHFGIHPATGEPFDWEDYDRRKKEKVIEKVTTKTKREFTEDDRNEVYAEIESRMRPSDKSLSYSELEEICISALMTEPDEDSMLFVNNIMHDYIKDRDEKYKDELKENVKDCIQFFKEDQGVDTEKLSFDEFYDWFQKGGWEDSLVKEYSREEVKKEFDNQLHPIDPDQLNLPLEENNKSGVVEYINTMNEWNNSKVEFEEKTKPAYIKFVGSLSFDGKITKITDLRRKDEYVSFPLPDENNSHIFINGNVLEIVDRINPDYKKKITKLSNIWDYFVYGKSK